MRSAVAGEYQSKQEIVFFVLIWSQRSVWPKIYTDLISAGVMIVLSLQRSVSVRIAHYEEVENMGSIRYSFYSALL